jgi:GMP synthase-like glutamine amidotransferase
VASNSLHSPVICIIDPAIRTPEVDVFNFWSRESTLPCSYHLPAFEQGIRSLEALEARGTKIAGILVLGSASSVHDPHPFIAPLSNWLRTKIMDGIPTFGICFGHQLIAHAFGGTVEFIFPERTKYSGLREVNIKADGLWDDKSLRGTLVKSHAEAVVISPKGFTVIGSSAECPIDAMKMNDRPCWTFQTHPESTPVFVGTQGLQALVTPQDLPFGHSIIRHFLHRCLSN